MAQGGMCATAAVDRQEDESAQLLANALKKMDCLIGNFRPVENGGASHPLVVKIVEACEQLHAAILEWREKSDIHPTTSPSADLLHPRASVPEHIQNSILDWMGGVNLTESQRLVQDKEELLAQVVSQQKQLEAAQGHASKLVGKVEELEKLCVQRDMEVKEATEELRSVKVTLSTREVELRHLKDQIQAGYGSDRGTKQHLAVGLPSDGGIQRRSFRRSLRKAFGMKSSSAKPQDELAAEPHPPTNPKAVSFINQSSADLCRWLESIGLPMYSDLMLDKHVTGEKLAEMVAVPTNQHLVQLGVLSSLHCKKLRLAVQAALSEDSISELDAMDHEWVGKWVESLGLPQYKQLFLDARMDGRMLNVISVQDLQLLDVTTPFHVASIKRGLESLRLCGYDKNYLSLVKSEKTEGSQKLLHWSCSDVGEWLTSIQLEQYAAALDKTGINGPIMYLDVQFTSESLAKALGISAAKTVLCKHLSRKFAELIGPVAAQRKVDAMQSKNFIPLDPTELPPTRIRSRSVVGRRGPKKGETLLLPVEPDIATGVPGVRSPSPI